jgi:hypothetical protein
VHKNIWFIFEFRFTRVIHWFERKACYQKMSLFIVKESSLIFVHSNSDLLLMLIIWVYSNQGLWEMHLIGKTRNLESSDIWRFLQELCFVSLFCVEIFPVLLLVCYHSLINQGANPCPKSLTIMWTPVGVSIFEMNPRCGHISCRIAESLQKLIWKNQLWSFWFEGWGWRLHYSV